MNFEFRDGISSTLSSPLSSPVAAGRADALEYGSPKSPASSKRVDEAGEKLAAEMLVFNQVAAELKAKRDGSVGLAGRCAQVLEVATELFGVAPTWTAFYRETVGVDGVVRALFTDAAEMREYECSDAHGKVLEMLTALRSRDLPDCDPNEPQRMITVRIPKSLHDSICKEANDLQVSVNKLCITRLIQRVDRSLIPSSTQKRRGRRPGAEYAKATAAASAMPSVDADSASS